MAIEIRMFERIPNLDGYSIHQYATSISMNNILRSMDVAKLNPDRLARENSHLPLMPGMC